jgi:hypothetical protein
MACNGPTAPIGELDADITLPNPFDAIQWIADDCQGMQPDDRWSEVGPPT